MLSMLGQCSEDQTLPYNQTIHISPSDIMVELLLLSFLELQSHVPTDKLDRAPMNLPRLDLADVSISSSSSGVSYVLEMS